MTVSFNEIYTTLKTGWDNSWLKFLFQRTLVGRFLRQTQVPSAFEFFQAYLTSWWWVRWWFRGLFQHDWQKHQFDWLVDSTMVLQKDNIFNEANMLRFLAHTQPYQLAEILNCLQQAGLLTQNIFNIVAERAHPEYLVNILSELQRKGLLTPENRRVIGEHANPDDLSFALSFLHQKGLLTPGNRAVVAAHTEPYNLASALSQLQEAGLLTDENRTIVAAHTNYPGDLASALSQLQEAGLLTDENRTIVAAHTEPNSLAWSLSKLHKAGLLTPENQRMVVDHARPGRLTSALSQLYKAGLLTDENQRMVVDHARPDPLASALSILWKASLLSQDNFSAVVVDAKPVDCALVLLYLHKEQLLTPENRACVVAHINSGNLKSVLSNLLITKLLTQDNFSALMLANHSVLLTEEAIWQVWNRIPNHLLTQVNYERLLAAAEHVHPLEELARVTNEMIGFEPGIAAGGAGGPAPVFNNTQSTHTASIHRTVSESARRLMDRYGTGLDFDATIANIQAWVYELDDSSTNEAVKRCIECITAIEYTHADPSSGVSTQQLLALAYIAIHDETKRQGGLEKAQALLLEGLYEIQRGYNIDEDGVDDNLADAPICIGGTFNKIMEKLDGIHPDVEVSYITHEGAYYKFPKLVRAHALAYLKSLASPMNVADYQEIKKILKTLEEEKDLNHIWGKIKEAVREALWGEFHEAYSGNQNDERFTNMIEYGWQNAVPDLSEIKAQLASSAGYQASVTESVIAASQASLSAQGLWAQPIPSSVVEHHSAFEPSLV